MANDPYVYPGTETLQNRLGIRDPHLLSFHEAQITHVALYEVTLHGVNGNYDVDHLQEFHRLIFGDVYPWAGELRQVDIEKDTSRFAHAMFVRSSLDEELRKLDTVDNYLRDLDRSEFVDGLTKYLSEVNAVHPFREGNGRTQRAFFGQLARDAGYHVALEQLDRQRNVDASRASFHGDNSALRSMLDELVIRPARD